MLTPNQSPQELLTNIPEMRVSILLIFGDSAICEAYLASLTTDYGAVNFRHEPGSRHIAVIQAKASEVYLIAEAVDGVAEIGTFRVKES